MDDRIRELREQIEGLKGGAASFFTFLALLEDRHFFELAEALSASFKIPFAYLPDEEDGVEVWFGVLHPNSVPEPIGVANTSKKSVALDVCSALIKAHGVKP